MKHSIILCKRTFYPRKLRRLTFSIVFVFIIVLFWTYKRRDITKRIDLPPYEVSDESCTGCPGELGEPVELLEQEKTLYSLNAMMKKDFFNVIVSNRISLWRSLPDTRHPSCLLVKYPDDLPDASVVIVFKNERFSILMRTVYSVVRRSPTHLLREVILVDDLSDLEELGKSLDDYCKKNFGNLVKIYRAETRLGLVKGRNFGARKAKGVVVVFLDAHCEANVGWLEPILFHLKEHPSAVACPIIDNIDAMNFRYSGEKSVGSIGGFTWSMFFTWISIPERIRANLSSEIDPIPSPTLSGGLLAANRNEFFRLGAYDDGMEVWGAENLEISFRVWMCGGSLEFIPCSRVGHVFRSGHPYNMTGEKGGLDVNGWNSARLVEVWLDDYKRHFYHHRKDWLGKDFGDVTERKNIREQLKCHDFKWFLQNIYPEKFIPDENVIAYGMLRNNATSLCLDTLGKNEDEGLVLGVFYCQGGFSASQIFSYTNDKQLCREFGCLEPESMNGDSVRIRLSKTHGKWQHEKNSLIQFYGSDLCLDVEGVSNNGELRAKKCDVLKPTQMWSFEKYV